ncbi:MAG: hypothetical protein JNM55_20885 [Anaerolineales bacterium]|nr:hypothetical protein [Anaerolineales bacterium]
MNFGIMLALCIAAWITAGHRYRFIHWKDVRKDNGIALNVWLNMLFFAITTLFLVKRFCDYFDAHTLNNLDRLISYSSLLLGLYFAAVASADAVGLSFDQSLLRRLLQPLLIFDLTILIVLYGLFLARIPNINYFTPRSLPEALFMLSAFSLAMIFCLFIGKIYLAYLPSEKSAVMHIRTMWFIVGSFSGSAYFITKIILAAGYFWPVLIFQKLVDISWFFLILTLLTHLSALLNNKLYLPLVVTSRRFQEWSMFKDLNYLVERFRQLCPEVALPSTNPSFLSFYLNSEYHLYRAVIAVMDGKTMLDDVLMEGALQGEPSLWEGDLLREAVRLKRALQAINPSGNFWEIAQEYRFVSKGLLQTMSSELNVEVT